MAANGKKSKKRIIIFSLIGVLVVALGLIVFLGSKKETVHLVQVEKVARRTITQLVTATGKIQPEVLVKISPEVSGEIVALPVREGDRVKRGALLMKIKPDVYLAQKDQASAYVLQAKATLSRTKPEFERVEALFNKGLASEAEFDQARAQYESAKASAAQAQASLDQASENLRKTTVFAPMDGTISQLNSELGERVLGTVQFQGTDVMTVADLSRMEARVNVSENDVVMVSIGDTVRIAVDAFSDRKVLGTVYEIANTATSRGTGTQEEVTNFQVKIRIVSKDVQLRPGMSMTADIETDTKADVLSIPIQCVTTRAPKQEATPPQDQRQQGAVVASGTAAHKRTEVKTPEIVFVAENGVVKATTVKRGVADDSYVEITEGLTEGQQVVSGSYKAINRELEDGSKIRIEEPKKAPAGPAQGGTSDEHH